jgi:hypothetical protein
LDEAMARGAALRSRTQVAVARASRLCEAADRVVLDTRTRLAARPEVRSIHRGWFRVLGAVDDKPVAATWSDGTLVADRSILERATAVVAMGDTFRRPGHPAPIRASLHGDQTTVLLTVLRAMSRTDSVEVAVPELA